jgi:hypothetical protein
MGDGEVRGENRHGIAEDKVFTSVEDSFLAFREMIQAKETSPFVHPVRNDAPLVGGGVRSQNNSGGGCPAEISNGVNIFFAHIGHTALDSSSIVLESYGKSPARNIPLPDVLKRFVAFSKILPGLFLLRQELETKC